MIVDVLDLNFQKINFSRRYDYVRENRARLIHGNGEVQIKYIDKLDENNYDVSALVKGTYDVYNVDFKICGTVINEAKCTCEDFRKGNLCKHILATALEIMEPHYASTSEGQLRLKKIQEEKRKSAIEEAKKREEEARRKREYERKYYDGLMTIERYKALNYNNNGANTLDLQGLYEETLNSKNKRVRKFIK